MRLQISVVVYRLNRFFVLLYTVEQFVFFLRHRVSHKKSINYPWTNSCIILCTHFFSIYLFVFFVPFPLQTAMWALQCSSPSIEKNTTLFGREEKYNIEKKKKPVLPTCNGIALGPAALTVGRVTHIIFSSTYLRDHSSHWATHA